MRAWQFRDGSLIGIDVTSSPGYEEPIEMGRCGEGSLKMAIHPARHDEGAIHGDYMIALYLGDRSEFVFCKAFPDLLAFLAQAKPIMELIEMQRLRVRAQASYPSQ